jgi:copper chaperone
VTNITLQVPEIHCGHCKASIEGAVAEVAGVDRVEVSIDARTVAVDFDGDGTTRSAIVDAIESQGYVVSQ